VQGNWKRDAIIMVLAEAQGPLIASEIAEHIPDLNRREVAQYISYNLRYKSISTPRKSVTNDTRHRGPTDTPSTSQASITTTENWQPWRRCSDTETG